VVVRKTSVVTDAAGTQMKAGLPLPKASGMIQSKHLAAGAVSSPPETQADSQMACS